MKKDRPLALLVQPPVYDFALYDLYLKPFGLLRIGRWLAEGGWDVVFVNGLQDPSESNQGRLRKPKRKSDGTGKFYRQPVETPLVLQPLLRPRIDRGEWKKRFARYGIPEEELRSRIRHLQGDYWPGMGDPFKTLTATLVREFGVTQPREYPRVSESQTVPFADRSPDLVLIGTGMTYWYLGVVEVVRICREAHPKSPLLVGGVYATLMLEHCRRITSPDGVMEGEDLSLFQALLEKHGLPVSSLPIPHRPIPFPSVWKEAGVIRLNTGCPLRCSYCASRALTPLFRPGDPDAAWEAFRELYEGCGTRNFAFYDDALLYRKEQVLQPFLERVVNLQDPAVRFYLPNGVHVSGLDGETVRLMRRAGVVEIRLGFESASEEFHRRYDGKVKVEEFLQGVSLLKQAGYKAQDISVYLLAGLPAQEAEEVEASIRFVKPTGVRVRLAEYSPVPSTQLWGESLRYCPFPLEEEPLFHNNSLFSMEWEGFPYRKLMELKLLAQEETGTVDP